MLLKGRKATLKLALTPAIVYQLWTDMVGRIRETKQYTNTHDTVFTLRGCK